MEPYNGLDGAPRRLRIRRKPPIWPTVIIASVLIGGVAGPIVTMHIQDLQTDEQINRQIAALSTITSPPTETPSALPSASPSTPASPDSAVTHVPTSMPVSQPDSVPIGLTCQSADLINLPVLRLPVQADPNVVDPPVTAKAVFWNPKPIVGSNQEFKVGPDSQTTAVAQGHFLIGAKPEAGLPFNKLSYEQYFPVNSICTVQTDSGDVLTYREEASVALTMSQWRVDPQFGVLIGPKRGYDLILQACDASDPDNLKRLVGFKLVR